jgi:hypothetical protein
MVGHNRDSPLSHLGGFWSRGFPRNRGELGREGGQREEPVRLRGAAASGRGEDPGLATGVEWGRTSGKLRLKLRVRSSILEVPRELVWLF